MTCIRRAHHGLPAQSSGRTRGTSRGTRNGTYIPIHSLHSPATPRPRLRIKNGHHEPLGRCAIGRSITTLLALLLTAGTALGQQSPSLNKRPAPPPPADVPNAINPASLPLTEDLTLEQAKEKARRGKRLLVIFWCGDTPRDPGWTFCRSSNSLSLRAYIKWHCVAMQTNILPGVLADQVCGILKAQSQETPAVIVMRDGKIEHVAGSDKAMMDLGADPFKGLCPRYQCSQVSRDVGCNCKQFTPGPIRVLFQTDFALDRIRARDPIWGETHDHANPPPQPPAEPEPICNTQDELGPLVRDPSPEETIGALDRLAQARAAMKSGDLYLATGLYSWLWERGSVFDPSFRGARLSAVAQDIAALITLRPGARERFDKIRNIRTERAPWADHGQMHEWFVLNAATGHASDTVEYLDYFVNDADEGTLAPPADTMAYGMLARRENYAAAWQLPPAQVSPAARVAAIAQRLNPKLTSAVPEAARQEYREFARQYLLDEGSRLYVACLVKGDEQGAQEIARTILAARNDAPARLALITTALAADPPQARPAMIAWLDEAQTDAGIKPRPDLRTRLMLGTTPAPKP